MSKKGKEEKPLVPKKPVAARTGRPPTGSTYVRLPLKIPLAYLQVLEREAERLQMGRGDFLNMLIQRRVGAIQLNRGDAPQYSVRTKDLAAKRLYTWYAQPGVRDRVDSMRLKMGGLGVGNFFVVVLNEWFGRPDGLQLEEERSKK